MEPVFDPVRAARAIPGYLRFLRDWSRYRKMEGAEGTRLIDTYPLVGDATGTSTILRHYFHQDRWAFRKILRSGVKEHVDVGSRLDLLGFLSVICRVTFIDIRPLTVPVDNLESREGSILALPYPDGSLLSLSCLHVAEHIGLGRYGDALDPQGTRKACAELARVLAPGGNLYFSLPVGKPRLCYSAHRIHTPEQILAYFPTLELVELSGVDDENRFVPSIDPAILRNADYACGLFHFTKR
jgi:SAM-dependent methyltransferase